MSLRALSVTMAVVSAIFLVAGCELLPDAPAGDDILDGPIEGLTPAQLSIFAAGDEEFGRRFTAATGLGPLFIAPSCDACHPGDGDGHPLFNITRFGRSSIDGFDGMRAHGGPQLQNRAIPGYVPEVVPAGVTGATQLTSPSITGLGFLEAVDDATILALADPNDADGDGISGRPQLIDSTDFIADIVSLESILIGDVSGRTRFLPVEGKFIGRFGKKAISVNLLQQTVTAYSLDMGLTTDLIPLDEFNVQVGNFARDNAPDPEVASNVTSNVVFYLKTLRPPPRRNEADAEVIAGERIFDEIQCAACHIPTLRTGASEIRQLSNVDFHPYTDLLLHDMGPELDDGYTEGIALTSEWRTPPLWGLGLTQTFQGGTAFYLHDGRASTLEAAIEFHGGEGAGSREAFRRLTETEKEQLIKFLMSL